ncbi:Two-component system sensor histidine kinase [Cytobacillus firmus]|uniref:histidine kinase n=1 Tax=Cytobacillus firmus TaxID=1399 RepID=A0A800MTX1_CYTFI|nr:Two-component system sensor histidine kinase [Cytobacillus firmus]
MNEVTRTSQQVIADLNNYFITPTPENLEKLNNSKEKMEKMQKEVLYLRNSENEFALTNYINLIDSLAETADRSLLFFNEHEKEDSAKEFAEATRISMYISEMTLTLIDSELNTYERFYRGIIEQSGEIKKLGIWVMLMITCLLMLLTYGFSLSITKPVKKLTQAANELSRGRFHLPIKVDSNDEIAFLAQTFDRMRININNLISEPGEEWKDGSSNG